MQNFLSFPSRHGFFGRNDNGQAAKCGLSCAVTVRLGCVVQMALSHIFVAYVELFADFSECECRKMRNAQPLDLSVQWR